MNMNIRWVVTYGVVGFIKSIIGETIKYAPSVFPLTFVGNY